MKTFLDLLATKLELSVVVNDREFSAGLNDPLKFNADQYVVIDGIEVLPKFWHLSKDGLLLIDEPFYCWYHRATNQGWLLEPQ